MNDCNIFGKKILELNEKETIDYECILPVRRIMRSWNKSDAIELYEQIINDLNLDIHIDECVK